MINNVIIAGSILMFTCVLITSLDYGHLVPDSLDGSICMVCLFVCVEVLRPSQASGVM